MIGFGYRGNVMTRSQYVATIRTPIIYKNLINILIVVESEYLTQAVKISLNMVSFANACFLDIFPIYFKLSDQTIAHTESTTQTRILHNKEA